MIDFVATEPHYAATLLPVWDALPDEDPYEGTFWNTLEGIPDDGTPTVCASGQESRFIPRSRPIALLDHGVGERYGLVDHVAFAGGRDREKISLFLCPSERVADLNRARYPQAQCVVVGCPRLDKWHVLGPQDLAHRAWSTRSDTTVAVSWHWDSNITHETHSAWQYFEPALARLAEQYRVLGHAHPRMLDTVKPRYAELGIETVADFDEIIERADLYAVDNSSTGFEWMAATDRPLVWLNSPIYRRGFDYSDLRFWKWADAGVQCDNRAHLMDAVRIALTDPPEVAARRRECVEDVFAYRDGRCTERAVEAILEWVK